MVLSDTLLDGHMQVFDVPASGTASPVGSSAQVAEDNASVPGVAALSSTTFAVSWQVRLAA